MILHNKVQPRGSPVAVTVCRQLDAVKNVEFLPDAFQTVPVC